ncbi:MAG: RDD family protein [Ornithinimicrobium sp.]
MTQPAGWYDDPQERDLLRYWDGTQWTTHTSPRHRPSVDQGSGGSYGSPQAYGGGQSGQYGQGGGAGTGGGGYGYGPMPGADFQQDGRPTTPDGQRISGWWRRFFARLLDGILLNLVMLALLPVVSPDFMDTFEQWFSMLSDPASLESGEAAALQQQIVTQLGRVTIVGAVISLVYEAVFLKVASATPGKLALGLRVRLREQPGPLEWSTSGLRALVWHGPSLLGIVPILGNIAALIPLVNGLWPLWDRANQSLNDKAAKTNVVRKS